MNQNNPINKLAHFDSSNFPQIHVRFESSINHIDEYNQFEKDWLAFQSSHEETFDLQGFNFLN